MDRTDPAPGLAALSPHLAGPGDTGDTATRLLGGSLVSAAGDAQPLVAAPLPPDTLSNSAPMDLTDPVRRRLAALSAHLAGPNNTGEAATGLLERSPVYGTAALGTRAGWLLVTDKRTWRHHEIEVSEDGTVRATDFKKITTADDDKGLKIYDPGYLHTVPVKSSICYIDRDKGIFRYRGKDIESLAESHSFEKVAYLLINGNWPTTEDLDLWMPAISKHSDVPQGLLNIIQSMPHDAHPMGVLASAMCTLSVFHPDANPALRGQDVYKSKQVRDEQIVRILGMAPTIAAAVYSAGRRPVLPSPTLSYSGKFLNMLGTSGDSRFAWVLDVLFILLAEHEMNFCTAAVRHLASSGVDVFTALSAGVGALYGPLHGGAHMAVLKMLNGIGSVEKVSHFIDGVKNSMNELPGFEHRAKPYDPRANITRQLADWVSKIVRHDTLFKVANTLVREASTKMDLYPTMDLYSGLIYTAMGFRTEFLPVLFAIPRMAGWLAHWNESFDDPDSQVYKPESGYSKL